MLLNIVGEYTEPKKDGVFCTPSSTLYLLEDELRYHPVIMDDQLFHQGLKGISTCPKFVVAQKNYKKYKDFYGDFFYKDVYQILNQLNFYQSKVYVLGGKTITKKLLNLDIVNYATIITEPEQYNLKFSSKYVMYSYLPNDTYTVVYLKRKTK